MVMRIGLSRANVYRPGGEQLGDEVVAMVTRTGDGTVRTRTGELLATFTATAVRPVSQSPNTYEADTDEGTWRIVRLSKACGACGGR